MTTAKDLHETLARLWPEMQLDMNDVGIDVGSMAWQADTAGCFLRLGEDSVSDPLLTYLASLPSRHEAMQFLERTPAPAGVIVLDTEACRAGGWSGTVKIALHEFAHAIRADLAGSGLYPFVSEMSELWGLARHHSGPLQNHRAAWGFTPEDAFSVAEIDEVNGSNLFNGFVTETMQHGTKHDLLFYLVLYLLNRKAEDAGITVGDRRVVSSAWFPGSPEVTQLAEREGEDAVSM